MKSSYLHVQTCEMFTFYGNKQIALNSLGTFLFCKKNICYPVRRLIIAKAETICKK